MLPVQRLLSSLWNASNLYCLVKNLVVDSVADLDPEPSAFLTPPRSRIRCLFDGMNNRDHISEYLETIFLG
jgi:hypothetical protein